MNILEIETPQSIELQNRVRKLFGESYYIPEIKYSELSLVKTSLLLRLIELVEEYDPWLYDNE